VIQTLYNGLQVVVYLLHQPILTSSL